MKLSLRAVTAFARVVVIAGFVVSALLWPGSSRPHHSALATTGDTGFSRSQTAIIRPPQLQPSFTRSIDSALAASGAIAALVDSMSWSLRYDPQAGMYIFTPHVSLDSLPPQNSVKGGHGLAEVVTYILANALLIASTIILRNTSRPKRSRPNNR